jgi:hypothetical protein
VEEEACFICMHENFALSSAARKMRRQGIHVCA